jgi:hypothetical protein
MTECTKAFSKADGKSIESTSAAEYPAFPISSGVYTNAYMDMCNSRIRTTNPNKNGIRPIGTISASGTYFMAYPYRGHQG